MPLCPRCGEENPERARFCFACGTALGTDWTAAVETRKVVTVLFADVTGSTALGERVDAEAVRTVILRVFDAARAAVELHGGTVEKFIGDAVLAVFGVPWVHEDDALRAVRAALGLREALAALNEELEPRYEIRLNLRMGLASGEAAVGADGLVVGDPVTVASRLEPVAAPGEILLDESTRVLVRDAVEVDAVEAAAGTVWRLRALVADVPFARRLDAPLVGRESELALLHDGYAQALEERACRLVTVLGPAGIGKSRLVRELVTSLPADARVLFGRCLPYGEGITYWPVGEIVRAAARIGAGTDAAEAVGRIAALLPDAEDAPVVADRVAGAIGLREAVVTPEEIFWAVRRLVEALAAARPLVLIFDDVHWAEPTFVDLVEHLADRTQRVPVLLLCTARPELHETRPGWPDERGALVELEPLDEAETANLIDHLETGVAVDAGLRARVAAAAGGNPLFLEEMLAMLGENGRRNGDEVALPPTIQALLAARLDRLAPPERDVIGRASVIGQEFTRTAVAELAGGRPVGPVLETLVAKALLRPEDGAGERFEFRHVLVRDAAYAALSKELRADLHELYARSLVRVAGARLGEVQEIVGYQLEQAHALRVSLAPRDEGTRSLATEAAGHLQAAGARASARGDLPAAAGLLERALALLPADDARRAELQAFAGATLLELGRLERAEVHLAGAQEAARASGARAVELSAGMALSVLHAQSDPTFNPVAAAAGAEQAIPELERLHADAALAGVWRLLVIARLIEHDPAALEHAATRALETSRRLRHARGEAEALFWLSLAIAIGPTPVEAGLRRCEELLAEAPGPLGSASVITVVGWLRACLGEIEEGRLLVRRGRDGFRELGFVLYAESSAHAEAMIELHAGDLDAAERVLREGAAVLEAVGETASLANQRGLLSWVLGRLGRPEEALEWSELGRQAAAARVAQAYWRRGRSLALARLGQLDEALELAREAVGVIAGTGDLHSEAEMLEHLAEIELEAGLDADARSALAQAAALYGRKGCSVCVARLEA